MRILNKIKLILESNLDFQGFINIIPTHPNPEVQPMVEFRVSFIRVTKRGQIFLRPDMSSYAAENSDHVQPVVVFFCKHNVTMRIQTKIQLMVEFRVSFMQVTTYRQFFTTWYIFITVRKRWGESTIDCIMLQIQHHNANLD